MFCSGLRSLAIPPLYLLYLPPLSDCAGSAVVKMDAQFIAARERLLRPQRGPTARYLLWPGWLNDVRCRARAQHHVARGGASERVGHRNFRYRVRLQASSKLW